MRRFRGNDSQHLSETINRNFVSEKKVKSFEFCPTTLSYADYLRLSMLFAVAESRSIFSVPTAHFYLARV